MRGMSLRSKCKYLSARVALLGVALGMLAWTGGIQATGITPESAEASALAEPEGVKITVTEDTGDRVVLEYELGAFTREPVDIDGHRYMKIYLGQEGVMKEEVGAPELPHVCRSIIIPNDAEMAARVLKSEYYELNGVDVVPSKGVISRKVNPADVPYTFGKAYETNAFYPGEVATLRKPYILRDYRGVVVKLQPFQYNPIARTLRVYTSVTVEVVKTRAGEVNVKNRPFRPDDVSLAFHQIYRGHFLNYETQARTRYTPLGETGDMLIIYYDSWASNIQPLVDHKNNTAGINTTAVAVGTIGNNSTSIANYIQNAYDTGDLAFVLLVGDVAQVATPSASGGASDPTYSKVSGSDDYPDIVIGRFSAQSAAEVDTQVLRTIEYETMPATQQSWFKKGFGVASAEGTGDDGEYDYEHLDNIRTDLLNYGYTTVDQLYATVGATDADVTNALNAGRGIGNYCGHGSATSWATTGFDNTDVNNLANDNTLPFIISVACNNGEFDNYTDCFAEAWLQATNGTEPTGAIGFYGSSISQSWSPPMCAQDESIDRLVDESYFSFGALCYAGSCQMMDEYGSAGITEFNTWHVFGDPSVRVYGTSAPPTGLKVTPSSGLDSSGDAGGPFSPDNIVYTLENLSATGINYSVTKSASWVSLNDTGGYLAGYATTDVTVSINSNANSLGNGTYNDTVNFINTTDHDGDTTRPVTLTVGVPSAKYSWNMDSNPGWSTAGLWAWGQPTGGGGAYGNPDPTSGYTGNNVYGYNLSGDYENSLSETHLTTAAIDCSALSDVSLKFWRWLGVEQPAYDHAYVRVSNNGSTWTQVWTNSAEVADSAWSQVEYDISAVADGQSTVYLRWTMGTTDTSWQFCGWNIDDVEIWALGGGEPTCDDGIQNQGEDLIDCGGPCPPCTCLVDGDCSDGVFCNGTEACDAYGECQAGSAPCPGQLCDETNDICVDCFVNGDCDDGLFCNGAETCVAGSCQAGTDPCPGQACDEVNDQCVPLPVKYTPAEYDQNEGMFIRWGSYNDILTDMTVAVTTGDPDAIVYVVVTGASQQSLATSTLTSAGADMGQVDFLTYTTDTVWIRDYGPRFISNDNVREVVDFEYNRPRPNDNGFPAFVGSLWSETVSEMDLTHGGGNLQVAGTDAFMSTLTLEENSGMSEQDVADIIDQYFNLDLTMYDRFPSSFDATGHVDMWMLPVSDSAVIVGEYSSSTGDPYTITENAVSDLTTKGYTVYRTPGWNSGGVHYTYTNAVVMNDVVLMPTYNTSEDATALAVFQMAFPSRTIVEVDCTSIISAAGAMHCIMDHVPEVTSGPTCSDGIQNQGEDLIDCGGPCPPCNCLVDGDCGDGLYCNGSETCDAYGECQPGTAIDCNDGVGCTDDSCNEGTDSCDNVANDAYCDNGLYCDGEEWCHATADCQPGTAVDCNDGVGCTDDSCNEGADSCDNVANDANCDNGLYCDGEEWCHATADCQPGTAVDCDDSVGCTDDLCNETTDSCDNVPNDANCADEFFCNGAETCDPVLDCQAGGDPCPGQVCDEVNDVCVDCVTNEDCDDGLYCNGAETCDAGTCVPGTAVDCSDGVGCTDDSCNEATDSCDNIANDANCDNGLYCDGTETCDALLDCQSGTAVDCDDSVGCTDDSCNEGTDSCDNVPNDANCDNGLYCDGTETCDALLDCQSGTTVDCNDGVSCTDDSCNEGTDSCDNVANDSYCPDDGLFCNGTEFCDAVDDCDHTGDPCEPGEICNEATDTCDPGDVAKLEGGAVTVGGSAVTVSLTNTYVSPVVVCSAQYYNNTIPVVARVTNVGSTSFDVWLENPSDGTVAAENVSYLVVEEGTWTIDGVNIEAQTYLSTVTDDASTNWYGEAQTYNQSYTDPVVLGQVMTANDAWSVFWCQGDARTNPPSSTTLVTGKTVCEDTDATRLDETVGFIVFEAGHGTIGGVAFEALLGADTVASPDDSPPYAYTFSTAFALAPAVAVTQLAAMDGNNGGWSQAHGATIANATTLYLSIEEDQIGDTERNHTTEQVGYVVFETAVVYPVGPECDYDWECDDGLYCNGAETCVDHSCQNGTAVDCDDGVACTDDSCNEGTDSCDNIANDANCDNGLYCDGAETCDALLGCQDGAAVDCDDGVACTDDSCNEGTDSCDNVPNDGYCDNGLYCDGAETCDALLGCQDGTAVDCDDSVGCTDDSCNEGTDSCDNVPNDTYCPDDGLFCNGTEYCDAVADCSSTGDPCEAGEVCNEETDTCDPGDLAKMEAGSVSVGGTPVTVSLTNTYVSPVVVCSVEYANNTTPVVTRVTSVGSTSFDVYLQNPSDGAVATENVSCIVVEEGVWTIDGVNVEAQTYLSTVTDENNSWVGEAQAYGQSYTNPVVLGQVMSDNDPLWSVFWCQGSSRTNPPSASALSTGKEVAEDTDTTRANETIGFIVFEASHGTIGGVEFEALVGADSVRGIDNAPPYTYTFNTAFASAPTVAVTTMAGMDGGNGGWSYTYGAAPTTATTLDLAVDEDQVGDSERAHTPEQVGYVVFGSALVYP